VSNAGAREALTEMLKGPTEAEIQQGFATAIPDGTRLLSYKVEDRKATVDFSSELKDYGGGSARVKGIVDQITNTVTANDPTVSSVEITIAGVPSEESLQP
jgi:spore germination protein GerM